MRDRPVIGVTCGVEPNPDSGELRNLVPFRYVAALTEAGAVPVLLPVVGPPHLDRVLDLVDGVVIGGGPDIPPDFYGQENVACGPLVPRERVRFDLAVVEACRHRRLPLLSICYGHQLTHVALGASLIQDLPTQVGTTTRHARRPTDAQHPLHPVRLDPGSRLSRILGAVEVAPVSAHHQAVQAPAAGLVATGWAPDGTLEASEDPDLPFFFTVQWHPELSPDEPHSRALFGALVASARSPRTGFPTPQT